MALLTNRHCNFCGYITQHCNDECITCGIREKTQMSAEEQAEWDAMSITQKLDWLKERVTK